jgi:hypothetical protein
MAQAQLSERVDSLENYMKELSYQTMRTEMELARLSQEMRIFKDEMKDFKDEMKEFKDEMIEFKDEMKEFKTEAEKDRRDMNRKWGELANKMGTMVEDIVAPNLPRIASELLDCGEPEYVGERVRRRSGPRSAEYDFLLICPRDVLINETKSNLKSRDVDNLLKTLDGFLGFFPEYEDRRLIGVLASLYVDESLIRYAGSKGVLVMAMGDETMEILNPEVVTG